MFKPTSSISSIIFPSDRHEIEVGINHLTKEDKKNQINVNILANRFWV